MVSCVVSIRSSIANDVMMKQSLKEAQSSILVGLLLMTLVPFSAPVEVGMKAATVFWDQELLDVKQGDNVTLTCTVIGVDILTVVRLVHRHHSTSVLLADNDDVKQQFLKLARYRVLYHIFDSIATVMVQINGIHGEDSGALTCHQLEDDVTEAVVTINVHVPIKEIYVIEHTPDGAELTVHEDGEVVLVQNEQRGVGCVTSLEGSFVEPSLNVTIGDRDVTDSFRLSVERSPVLMESGLTLFYVTVRRVLITSQPDPDYNGHLMTCTAAVQYGYLPVSASVIFVVQYAPIITCPRLVKVRTSNPVTISCTIRANPGTRVTWLTPSKSRVTDQDMSTHNTVTGTDESRVFLTIDSVFERHVGNYTLRADNVIGYNMAVVRLVAIITTVATPSPTTMPAEVRNLQLKQDAMVATSGIRSRSASDGSARIVLPKLLLISGVVTIALTVIFVLLRDQL